MTDALVIDHEQSAQRRADLARYLETAVDDGATLTCRSAPRCRASVTRGRLAVGQLSHVGSAYALTHRGRPLRVLVVPMQTGRDDHHVTMEQRTAQVDSAKPISARRMPRTPHMDGTALALKVLLGLDPEDDDEVAPGLHVFDCFAMANATLCSYLRPAMGSAGEGTATMRQQCRAHLRRTIAVLEPTVIVAQGTGGPSTAVADVLGISLRPRQTTAVRAPHGTIGVALLSHPAREWNSPQRRVFRDEVMPALRRARACALGESSPPT